MGVSGGVGRGVLGVWGAGGVLARGRPRKQASKAKARLKGEGHAWEVSGSPKEATHSCGLCKFPGWGLTPASGEALLQSSVGSHMGSPWPRLPRGPQMEPGG